MSSGKGIVEMQKQSKAYFVSIRLYKSGNCLIKLYREEKGNTGLKCKMKWLMQLSIIPMLSGK